MPASDMILRQSILHNRLRNQQPVTAVRINKRSLMDGLTLIRGQDLDIFAAPAATLASNTKVKTHNKRTEAMRPTQNPAKNAREIAALMIAVLFSLRQRI